MKKQIKRQGTQNIISFTSEEMKINRWKEGDILDLTDVYSLGPHNYPGFKSEDNLNKKEVKTNGYNQRNGN
jgi:hypothetical protein